MPSRAARAARLSVSPRADLIDLWGSRRHWTPVPRLLQSALERERRRDLEYASRCCHAQMVTGQLCIEAKFQLKQNLKC